MSIDLSRELPIPLKDVPKLPWLRKFREDLGLDHEQQGGRRLHVSTVHRWCSRGIRGKRLEYVQLGGTRVTTEAALLRFFHSLKATAPPEPAPGPHRRRGLDQVDRKLDALL